MVVNNKTSANKTLVMTKNFGYLMSTSLVRFPACTLPTSRRLTCRHMTDICVDIINVKFTKKLLDWPLIWENLSIPLDKQLNHYFDTREMIIEIMTIMPIAIRTICCVRKRRFSKPESSFFFFLAMRCLLF